MDDELPDIFEPEPPQAPPTGDIAYTGEGGQVLSLSIKFAALSAVTLLVYRFWAITRMRRHFWGHILVKGEPLEYSGQGRELFKGFIIAALAFGLGVVLPFQMVALFVPDAAVPVGIAYALVIYVLMGIAGLYARRYRLSRTSWNGIRMGQELRVAAFLKLSAGWYLAEIATLGLLHPWRRVAQQRLLLNMTRVGTLAVENDSSARGVFLPWLLAWLPPAVLATLAGIDALSWTEAPSGKQVAFLVPVLGGGMLWLFLLYPRYRAREFRLLAAGTRLGPIRLESRLRGRSIVRALVLSSLLASAVSAGFFSILAGVIAVATMNSPLSEEGVLTHALAGLNFIFALCIGMVYRAMSTHWLIRAAVQSLTVIGTLDPAEIRQGALAVPGYGEGLAGIVDFAG